jgi:glycosyltransferase involved in cell wall biosynthesis
MPLIAPLFKRKGLVFYPYAFIGTDGEYRRINQFLPFLEKDGIPYKVCRVMDHKKAHEQYEKGMLQRYALLIYVFYVRIFQILAALRYEKVFIQRGLWPVYFDLEHPFLEKTLYSINKNVVIDFWDSVFVKQEQLTLRSLKYAKVVSVSNEFLMEFFQAHHDCVMPFNVSIDLSAYTAKQEYSLHNPMRIVWTGQPHNLVNLSYIEAILEKVNQQYPLVLVVIGKEAPPFKRIAIEHHEWKKNSFYNLLESADIGIYPERNTAHAKGKSAMKVMDYLSAGLPMIGVPYGLAEGAIDGEHLLIAERDEDWQNAFARLVADQNLREKLGKNGRKLILDNYSIDENYKQFLALFGTQNSRK